MLSYSAGRDDDSVSMLASYYGIVPERPEDDTYYTDFQLVCNMFQVKRMQVIMRLLFTYMHSFMNELCLQKANIMAI